MSTLNDMKFKSIMAKRKDAYQGNSEMDPEQFAHGGMSGMKDGGMSYGGMMRDGGMKDGGKMADGGSVDKKKSAVMAIIAKIGKKPMASQGMSMDEMEGESEGDMPSGPAHAAKMMAAEEVMGALKGGDTMAFSDALENFIKACGSYED